MKSIILVAATLFATCSAMADLVATNGENELRLMPARCMHGGILGHMHADHRPFFKKGQAWVAGRLHYVCWADTGEGIYWVIFENGEGRGFSITDFVEQHGV